MEAVVSDIIASRMREPGGFKQTAVVSLIVHAAVVAVLAAMPGVIGPAQQAPRAVMHISLGGSAGPKTGGLEQLGGRPIVAAQPGPEPKVAKPQLPSLKDEPKMVFPIPDPKLKPKAAPKNAAVSKDPAGKPTGRGAETQAGTAKIETGARGQGFGLSTGGGGGDGQSHLDVSNFCCPEYLLDMKDRVERVWNKQQQSTGTVMMKYTILRNGTISDIQVERSSMNLLLDRESQRALSLTRLAPLPSAFPDDHLTVHLEFQYERTR
ncbi:MAG TPA: TonB family protein [Planctomycetaceae bacterium]|nr:TonB family protein [Planctomycetaceae bacterium]